VKESYGTGERVVLRRSGAAPSQPEAQSAVRPPATLFMGTGVEGRRKESSASPANSGRCSMPQAGHRASLPGASPAASIPRRAAAEAVVAPQMMCGGAMGGGACSSGGRRPTLEVAELQIGADAFNPAHPSVRSQLASKLGISGTPGVEEMQGFRGGLNEGVWFLTDMKPGGNEVIVLKLVRGHRIATAVLTESENFLKLNRDHPGIANDPSVAFPVKIFNCFGPDRQKRYDLIAMKKVRGERLAELIARLWYGNKVPQLMQVFERLGVVLAEFHQRYGNSQHGDFQPSNIFYDEDRGDMSLIDIGGMGVPTMETDVEHFERSMKLLAEAYGAQLARDGIRAFQQGYARSR